MTISSAFDICKIEHFLFGESQNELSHNYFLSEPISDQTAWKCWFLISLHKFEGCSLGRAAKQFQEQPQQQNI